MIVSVTGRRLVGEGCQGIHLQVSCRKKPPRGGHGADVFLPLKELCPGMDQLSIAREQAWMEGHCNPGELNLCVYSATKLPGWP